MYIYMYMYMYLYTYICVHALVHTLVQILINPLAHSYVPIVVHVPILVVDLHLKDNSSDSAKPPSRFHDLT